MTPTRHIRVLFIEDSADDAALLVRELRKGDLEPSSQRVEDAAGLVDALRSTEWDIVVSDHAMPHFDSFQALKIVREERHDIPFIVVSGTVGEETAVEVMKAGANDYLLKDNLIRLVPAIVRELAEADSRRQRRLVEEQLRQAQKMEAVGQLTGGVAHDFNNLLTVVIGNLELIAARVSDPETDRMTQTAIKASRRGAELTQHLLAFSRRQTLTPVVIDLDQLVSEVTDLMRRTLGESIEIDVAGTDDLWKCEADHSQLENSLLNLALNARDAMPQGGKLTIETTNAKLDDLYVAARNEVSPGEYVKVVVSDTGTGMPQDVIDHAFEPFFTTKDVGAGSGLGLSMVQGFIKQSDGFVTIKSTENVGTTVTLFLPRSAGSPAPFQDHSREENSVSHGEKILVVEDDPDVRSLTVNFLADLGYDTVEAANGNKAIELLQQMPGIDLVFTDIGLPGGMSGIDIAKEVSQHFPNVKILFTSGYGDDILARHGGIDGGFQLLHKPFNKDELAKKLTQSLN